jgi:hypothetical protein
MWLKTTYNTLQALAKVEKACDIIWNKSLGSVPGV